MRETRLWMKLWAILGATLCIGTVLFTVFNGPYPGPILFGSATSLLSFSASLGSFLRIRLMKEGFEAAFGVAFPITDIDVVRCVVIGKIIAERRIVGIARERRDLVEEKWRECSPETVGGAEQRLALQREYDTLVAKAREAQRNFDWVCGRAADAGFEKEVRAFGSQIQPSSWQPWT
jgi:hypothetical protein